jgi:hypothetical protein
MRQGSRASRFRDTSERRPDAGVLVSGLPMRTKSVLEVRIKYIQMEHALHIVRMRALPGGCFGAGKQASFGGAIADCGTLAGPDIHIVAVAAFSFRYQSATDDYHPTRSPAAHDRAS